MLYENIKKLVEYGIQTGLTPECERIYTTNLLLELFQEDSYEDVEIDRSSIELETVLEGLLDEAVKRGIIEDSIGFRDLFDTKIMGLLMPRPSEELPGAKAGPGTEDICRKIRRIAGNCNRIFLQIKSG